MIIPEPDMSHLFFNHMSLDCCGPSDLSALIGAKSRSHWGSAGSSGVGSEQLLEPHAYLCKTRATPCKI